MGVPPFCGYGAADSCGPVLKERRKVIEILKSCPIFVAF